MIQRTKYKIYDFLHNVTLSLPLIYDFLNEKIDQTKNITCFFSPSLLIISLSLDTRARLSCCLATCTLCSCRIAIMNCC